jgi:hypothetical protein
MKRRLEIGRALHEHGRADLVQVLGLDVAAIQEAPVSQLRQRQDSAS